MVCVTRYECGFQTIWFHFPCIYFFLNICNTELLDSLYTPSTSYEHQQIQKGVLTMELVTLLDCHYVFVLFAEDRMKKQMCLV